MKLVIIEGAGKKDTIKKHLGSEYKVFATKGHIRDLPVKYLSVDVKNNFAPTYKIMDDKAETVAALQKEASSAKEILIATDPDREGEAISWHVAHILKLDATSPVRIVFNEISKKAIEAALSSPRPVNQDLVDAQQARRVLDRLVGYKLSPVLCKKIQNKLSAGRVQSVTLRLVVDREREIRSFIPEEYWPFFSVLQKDGSNPFKAALSTKSNQKIKLTKKEEVDETVNNLKDKSYIVKAVKRSVTKQRPQPPFITSSLQQDALNKLGFSLKQTSSIAQTLYEGVEIQGEGKVALVTYIRTDSTRVSADAVNEARDFIKSNFGENYVPEKPNFYASKKGAQDAHEAIRPINIKKTPESIKSLIDKNQYRLYKLIFDRFLASQMKDAEFNSLIVDIEAGDYGFKVTGKTPLFDGFTAVYASVEPVKKEAEEADEQSTAKLPDFTEGEFLEFIKHEFEQKFTKPPPRYTEASLVKAMEEKGIGRPATYTQTIVTLLSRIYIEKEEKKLKPTQLGETVVDMLIKYFPDIMNVSFTAQMEEELDKIEDGGMVWQSVIAKFYEGFEEKIKEAVGDDYTLKEPAVETDIMCENCGKPFMLRQGRYGKFLGCSGFPKCRTIKQAGKVDESEKDDNGVVRVTVQPESTGIKCEKCGKEMALRSGKFGEFYACPGYPECKNIVNKDVASGISYGDCPDCKKPLRKIAKQRPFYGCTGYPDCKFISNNPLSDKPCEKCNSYMVIKQLKQGEQIACSNKECK